MRLVNFLHLEKPNEALLFALAGFCNWRSCREVRDLVMGCKLKKSSTFTSGLCLSLLGYGAAADKAAPPHTTQCHNLAHFSLPERYCIAELSWVLY